MRRGGLLKRPPLRVSFKKIPPEGPNREIGLAQDRALHGRPPKIPVAQGHPGEVGAVETGNGLGVGMAPVVPIQDIFGKNVQRRRIKASFMNRDAFSLCPAPDGHLPQPQGYCRIMRRIRRTRRTRRDAALTGVTHDLQLHLLGNHHRLGGRRPGPFLPRPLYLRLYFLVQRARCASCGPRI
jgi:hypothetical protein